MTLALVLSLLTACKDDKTLDSLKNDYGASIEGGSFPEGSILVTTPIDETSKNGKVALDAIKGQDYNTFKPVYIFDISVVKDDAKVQPNGKVKVTIPVTADLVSYRTVFHIKDDNTVEKLSATYSDGKLTFETDSFSIFVLTETAMINVSNHTHTFDREWSQSETHHWHAATCGHDVKDGYAEHYYEPDGWWVSKEATETEEGERVRVCIGCKYEDHEVIPKVDHTHTYSKDWSSDGEYHWHAATCAHTSEVEGKELCSGGSATCAKKAICSVCGNEYGDMLDHDFSKKDTSEKYLASAATCLEHATYYYSCKVCGEKGTETFEDTNGKLASCHYDEADVCTVCEVPASAWLKFTAVKDSNGFIDHYKVTGYVSTYESRKTEYVRVPSTYEGKPVTEIGDIALYFSSFRHVVLPDSIEVLGGNCPLPQLIETLTIGNGLKTIAADSFGHDNGGCTSLRQITISEDNPYFKVVHGVMYTKDGKTLVKYPALMEGEEFAINNTVQKIWSHAFGYTKNLKSAVIPDSVTEIMEFAFNSSSLQRVEIGSGVKTIPKYAFYNCALRSVKLEKISLR